MEDVRLFLAGLFNEDETNRLLHCLQELGAESMADVRHLNVETDLADSLPVLKRRRLCDSLNKLKNDSIDIHAPVEAVSATSVLSNEPCASASGPALPVTTVPNKDSGSSAMQWMTHVNELRDKFSNATPDSESGFRRTRVVKRKMPSVMVAIKKHAESARILEEMRKPVPDEHYHRAMIKAVCSHLIDCFGSYPPPDKQLAMAIDIVKQFPERASQSGKGYEVYYCPGTGKGLITCRMREIYRRYPQDQKKYRPRQTASQIRTPLPLDDECSTEEEFITMKTKMAHMVFSERTENELLDFAKKTFSRRRLWVAETSPTAAEFLQQYPRFADTPSLIGCEFHWIQPGARVDSSVFLQTKLAIDTIRYCKAGSLYLDTVGLIDLDTDVAADPDKLVKAALVCLLRLLPTTGKHRVSTTTALRYILEEIKDPMDLEAALKLLQQQNATLERTQPYLLQLGTGLFIVADGVPVLIKPATLSLGIDSLLKSYFVLNTKYPKQGTVVFNFLQQVVLDIPAPQLSPKARKLSSELSKI